MVSSRQDSLYVNMENQTECDIDETYSIDNIRQIVFEGTENYFYVVSNSYKSKLGIFVIKINV